MYNNGKNNTVVVHKLIALTWVPLPKNYTLQDVLGNWRSRSLVVDHIDGNKTNFNASNLRWCSQLDNANFENYDKGKKSEALKGNQNAKNKKTPKNVGELRYTYHYNGKDYTMRGICKELNCNKSKITESFRKNLGLVRAGKLTRTASLSKLYKNRLIAELQDLVIKIGDNYEETNPDVIRANEILKIIASYSKEV